MVNRLSLLALFPALALAFVACDEGDEAAPVATAPAPLDARQILIRASLDVRGIRPTRAEVARVTAAPEELDATIATFVDHPGFGARVRAIFSDAVRTRRDHYRFGAEELGLTEDDEPALHAAMAEETLNIISFVAVSDRPFTEVLTADYTVVDPILVAVWPLAETPEQPAELPPGTVMARYGDGRPPAGVLATNSFFWRHTSTVENANRGRSNAISRAFLCEDYLDRPIDFPRDVDLTNEEALQNAIRQNPGCQACHATLDPFASHLWGFMYVQDDNAYAWTQYHPENERMWRDSTQATPAFFGEPTDGTLTALGGSIASDERFVSCAVQRVYESLLGRTASVEDEGQLAHHREAFLASGLSLKALVRSVLLEPAYRGATELSAYGATPQPVALKLASPELLSSSLFNLTGYTMSVVGRDVTSIDFGVRALAGGSERGFAGAPSLGHALVQRRLAEASALALTVERESFASSRLGALLPGIDTPPTAANIVELVAETRSLAVAEDSADVTALLALYDEAGGGEEGWSAVLTALLADPELAVY